MQTITLSNGQTFAVKWFSKVAAGDSLRFGVVVPKGQTVVDILTAFMDAENVSTVIHTFDEYQKRYDGYTVFSRLEIRPEYIEVVLRKA